jgi:Cd2+/Zn2+-exporting ATPase
MTREVHRHLHRHGTCVARTVADALHDEPSLEAVTIDRTHQTVSVATLGRTDAAKLARDIRNRLEQAQEASDETACSLLTGHGDCTTCERPLNEQERGGISIQNTGCTTTIARVTCPTAPKFWRWRNIPFPKVVQRELELPDHDHGHHADEWKLQLAAAAICGVLGITAFVLGLKGQGTLSLAGYIAAYIAGAWFAVHEVWERLQKGAIDVHFLMLAVAAGAASIGGWAEGTTLLFLFSLSGALEHYAMGRTQKEIRSLFREAPKFAIVLDANGNEITTQLELLRPGMRLLVRPDSQFPVDAEILKGSTAADESNLTGESAPVDKTIGDTVLAGTINLWGAVEVTVLRPASESALQKIIRLIKEAQQQKAPSQRFTDKFGTNYTYAILGLTALMFFVWWLGFQYPPFLSTEAQRSAFYRAMTLLVVASPCALVLSIPSAVLAAIASGARHGILMRGGAAVEKLAEINVVALDKTGTLTTGELRVEKIESFPPGHEAEIARLAYSLERLSNHPLARAIVRYGKQHALDPLEFEKFESIAGLGLKAVHNGKPIVLGRREWIVQSSLGPGTTQWQQVESGFSEVWLSSDGLAGRVILRDDIRPQARLVVDKLKHQGLRTVVLTGDRQATAERLRSELHLDEVHAGLKPDEKVSAIRSLTESGKRVAMIGDGVNDAPSLAVAHVGVAMGARGSDAALEQADVVLMHDRLENFLAAFELSKRARRIIRQNLIISLSTVALLVIFALMGKIPLPVGVVGHEGSTVIVVMNSLRLLLGARAFPGDALKLAT